MFWKIRVLTDRIVPVTVLLIPSFPSMVIVVSWWSSTVLILCIHRLDFRNSAGSSRPSLRPWKGGIVFLRDFILLEEEEARSSWFSKVFEINLSSGSAALRWCLVLIGLSGKIRILVWPASWIVLSAVLQLLSYFFYHQDHLALNEEKDSLV